MSIIKYKLLQGQDENGQNILSDVIIGFNEANEEIAKKEAFDGYEIIDGEV